MLTNAEELKKQLEEEILVNQDTFEKLQAERFEEANYHKQMRKNYKDYLDHQMAIPVFKVPKFESDTQVFGDSMSQTAVKTKNIRKKANSVSNFNYKRFYNSEKAKLKNEFDKKKLESEISRKNREDFKNECSRQWEQEMKTQREDNQIRARQVQDFKNR